VVFIPSVSNGENCMLIGIWAGMSVYDSVKVAKMGIKTVYSMAELQEISGAE